MNSFSQLTAQQFYSIFFGGNWTVTNMKEVLSDITVDEAKKKIDSFNSILALIFHINYFIADALIPVLEGKPLDANDKLSFDYPEIKTENEWQDFLQTVFLNAEKAAKLIAELSDEKLVEDFANKKYGTYFRNIHGIIEHTHYHLGQIVILKKNIQK
ncbi:MAG: hypothetical protein RIQ33_438 [Bacteroidota bacterium]|jgi:hypothetical protein